MSSIKEVVNTVKATLKAQESPLMTLPSFLLQITTIRRPGMSAMDVTSEIIQNNAKLGINTGTNPDGSQNVVNAYTYNVVKTILEAIKMQGSVHCVIPAGSLTITGTGANAGGPVEIVGTNSLPLTIKGIMG